MTKCLVLLVALTLFACERHLTAGIGMTIEAADQRSVGFDFGVVRRDEMRLEGRTKGSLGEPQATDETTILFGEDTVVRLPRVENVRLELAEGRVLSLRASEFAAPMFSGARVIADALARGWMVRLQEGNPHLSVNDPFAWACPWLFDGDHTDAVVVLVHPSEVRMEVSMGCGYERGRLVRWRHMIYIRPDDAAPGRGTQPLGYYQEPLSERKRVAVPRFCIDGRCLQEMGEIVP